jgi:hypothetical protein
MVDCVLIVDDDPPSARWILREVSARTPWVGVVADSLGQAASLLEDKALHIGVLVTDFYFRSETHDEKRELFDGLDLVQFAVSKRPNLKTFIVSAYADDPHVRDKIASLDISVDGIFNRFNIGAESDKSLWTAITSGLRLPANMPQRPMLYDIFLAYNRKDHSDVRRLYQTLAKQGMDVWFDDGHLVFA